MKVYLKDNDTLERMTKSKTKVEKRKWFIYNYVKDPRPEPKTLS